MAGETILIVEIVRLCLDKHFYQTGGKGSMNKGSFKILGWIGLAMLVLLVGAMAGGGGVYALTQNQTEVTAPLGQIAPDEPGIVIASVIPDGPAAQAGVKRGDILLKLNDQPTNSFGELLSQLQTQSAGDQATLTVLHGDAERILTVTLGDRNGNPYLGLVPCSGLPARAIAVEKALVGATIINVTPNSPADQAGLQRGDTITTVAGQAVDPEHKLNELIGAHQPGDTVTLTVQSPGEEAREITVTLDEHPDQAGAAHLGVQFSHFPRFGFFRDGPMGPGGPYRFEDHLFRFPGNEAFQGALIQAVAEDSPAAAAGLSEQDVITAIDGKTVKHPRDLIDAVARHQPGDTVTLTVAKPEDDITREVTVTLAEHPDQAGQAYLGVQVGGFFRLKRSEDGSSIEQDIEMIVNPQAMLEELPLELELPRKELNVTPQPKGDVCHLTS